MAQASLKIWIKLENQQATKLRNVPADADVDDVVLAAIEQLQSSLRDTSPGQVTVYDCSGNILERDQNVSELLARKCGDTTNTAMVFKYVEGISYNKQSCVYACMCNGRSLEVIGPLAKYYCFLGDGDFRPQKGCPVRWHP